MKKCVFIFVCMILAVSAVVRAECNVCSYGNVKTAPCNCLPNCSEPCCAGDVNEYSLILMSDTHYDKQKYDENTVLPSYWTSEHTRNMGMWDNGASSLSYIMLDQVKAAVDDSTKFIIHAGDLAQGDFDGVESAVQANLEAMDEISGIIGLPLYVTLDNHDYCRTMSYMDPNRYPTYDPAEDLNGCKPTSDVRVEMASAVKQALKNYAIENLKTARLTSDCFMTKQYGKDIYIFTQASNAGLKYLNQELERFPKENVRYTFVIIHLPPVLGKSYGVSKPWQTDCFHYYAKVGNDWVLTARDQKLQHAIQSNLAAREAIIFSGHKHYWEQIDARFSDDTTIIGTIHQLMTNVNDVSYSWKSCATLQDWPAHAAADSGTFLDQGEAQITKYALWSDRGFVKLYIDDTGVTADVYSCNQGGAVIKNIKLR